MLKTNYDPDPELFADVVTRRFVYHAPKGDQLERYTILRNCASILAQDILRMTPPGREQSLALTKLEEAIFFANAAIARGEADPT